MARRRDSPRLPFDVPRNELRNLVTSDSDPGRSRLTIPQPSKAGE
jgi:hypothetical protein